MKRLSVLSIISFIIILIVIVLFVLNRYYEINSDNISIPIICCCLIFTVIILAIVQMVKSGKKRLSKVATIGLVLIAPFVYRIGHDLLGSWKTYKIYSKDGYMIIARINESEYGMVFVYAYSVKGNTLTLQLDGGKLRVFTKQVQ